MTELVDVPVLGTGVIRRVGSSPTEGNIYLLYIRKCININIFIYFFLMKVFIFLALNYLPRGSPPKYFRLLYVSLLSSGWNKVVPYKLEH